MKISTRINNTFKPYLIAAILLLQAYSVYVAWNLDHTVKTRSEVYLQETTKLASAVIEGRMVAVTESLTHLGVDVHESLAIDITGSRANALIDHYKTMWNYHELALIGADGKPRTPYNHKGIRCEQILKYTLEHSQPQVGYCKKNHALAYTIPIMEEDRLVGVVFALRSIARVHKMLDVPMFGGVGLALFIDHAAQVATQRWIGDNTPDSGDGSNITSSIDFVCPQRRIDGDKISPDYKLCSSGNYRFNDSNGEPWLFAQQANCDYGYTIAFAAPEKLLLHSLPTLRLWNLVMNALSVLLVGFLLVDIIVLQASYRKKLRMTENTDPLTLGPTASSFAEQVATQLQQNVGRYAVVSLDINKFKLVNDAHGIDKANELLRLMYGVFESRLKNGELCARANADTFLLFLRCTAPSALRQRLNALVAEFLRRKKDLGLTLVHGLSVGVYVVKDRFMPPVSMIDRANFARTISKDTIGTPVTFYDAAAGESLRQESELLSAFSDGMKNGELFIELQPKVNIRTDLVAGAEALVRWRHPERGLLSPSEFLPALEKAGRIVELDLWVFEQVCALLARWNSEGREVVPVSVNLSRTHLSDENFINNYLKILQKYEVKPHWLELELTESIFVEDQEEIVMTFEAIRSHGLRCSIDDFGTGYSSLSMLKNANVDTVKLDRSFFLEDELDEQTCSILMSIIQLSTALGFTCVAEGVEKRSTVEFLMRTDCALVQGWVYSRALSVEDFERYAFREDKRRRLLDSGLGEKQPRLPMPGGGRNTLQLAQALNSLGEVGVFVVKKVSREILFCNEVLRRRSGVENPEGQFCHAIWGATCRECPVAFGDEPCVDMLSLESVFGCPVRKTATEIMWDESIPAYLVVLVPERKSAVEDDEEELERLRLQASLWKRKAQEDELTSLLGRTQFKAEVERRMRNRADGVLLFIDLDSFKQVNDRFGHQMGDVVLKNTSERIRLSFRSDDLIGRFGGDEFVVYASGFTDSELLTQRIGMLLNLLRHPHHHGKDTVSISASIGVARFPLDAKGYNELERRADDALYEAKSRGKDRFVSYSELREAPKPEAKERKASAHPYPSPPHTHTREKGKRQKNKDR